MPNRGLDTALGRMTVRVADTMGGNDHIDAGENSQRSHPPSVETRAGGDWALPDRLWSPAMSTARTSGILLHPTSLPGPYGIGELGSQALTWLDWLASTGCELWQVLPLGPTGFGDSPYQSFSSFAGNPYLVSLEELVEADLLASDDFATMPDFPEGKVDFGPLIQWKTEMLDRAHRRFQADPDYDRFVAAESEWLEDFALFMAVKEDQGGSPWTQWPPELRDRHPAALSDARVRLAHRIDAHRFRQYLFFGQWDRVRERAGRLEVRIVGDLPIFVAHDSADVWARPDLFRLDSTGQPEVVAGVPPDYFSATGQLWGNPLYRWDRHAADGYRWWLERLKAVLRQVDIVRIDHFRAFADYWEIPGDAETAESGRWLDGPGAPFFEAVKAELGELPIIAEDLGELSPKVFDLRDQLGLPGMKILQFAFDDDETNPFLPHNYPENCVAYTGTHDNDTTVGWYASAPEEERHYARTYLGIDGTDMAWSLIETIWRSRADYVLAPMQDLLALPSEHRMNLPGSASGNWGWRLQPGALTPDLAQRLRNLNEATGRLGR